MREWMDEWTKKRRGRELYRLEPSLRRGTIKIHIGLSKELSSLVVLLFHRRFLGIEDGRCECRQGNQTVKPILVECRQFARQRRNLWTEEAKRARKEGWKEFVLSSASSRTVFCAKKAAIFMADWPVYTQPTPPSWRTTNLTCASELEKTSSSRSGFF